MLINSNKIVLLAVLTTATYIYLSMSSYDIQLTFSVILWTLSVFLVAISNNTKSSNYYMYRKMLIIALVGILFAWPQYLWYLPTIKTNFVTQMRFEAYIANYQKSGHIVALEHHGTLFSDYLIPYILMEIANIKSRFFYVFITTNLNYFMVVSVSLLLSKKLRFSDPLILIALYSYALIRIERNAIDLALFSLIILYIHRQIEANNLKRNSIKLALLTFALSITNFPLTILLMIILIISLFLLVKFQNLNLFKHILIFLLLIIAVRFTVDVLFTAYLFEYRRFFDIFVNYFMLLLEREINLVRLPLTFLKQTSESYFFFITLSFIRQLSLIFYAILLIFSFILSLQVVRKYNERFLISKAIALTYFILIAFAIGIYLIRLTNARISDLFTLYMFDIIAPLLPLVIVFGAVTISATLKSKFLLLLVDIIVLLAQLTPMYDLGAFLTLFELSHPAVNFLYYLSSVLWYLLNFHSNMKVVTDTPILTSLLNLYTNSSLNASDIYYGAVIIRNSDSLICDFLMVKCFINNLNIVYVYMLSMLEKNI